MKLSPLSFLCELTKQRKIIQFKVKGTLYPYLYLNSNWYRDMFTVYRVEVGVNKLNMYSLDINRLDINGIDITRDGK